MEKELKVTFCFGLSLSFFDITMDLKHISLPNADMSLASIWHLSS